VGEKPLAEKRQIEFKASPFVWSSQHSPLFPHPQLFERGTVLVDHFFISNRLKEEKKEGGDL